ncbi:MAG: FmdB family zinc ribbon protein [Candidatus Aquicultorales bacterium]
MPTFDFYCSTCDKKFELLVGVGRTADPLCPVCGSTEIKQLITAFRTCAKSGSSEASDGGASGCSSCSSTNCGTCGV